MSESVTPVIPDKQPPVPDLISQPGTLCNSKSEQEFAVGVRIMNPSTGRLSPRTLVLAAEGSREAEESVVPRAP